MESQLEVYLCRSEPKRVGRFPDAFRFLWVMLFKYVSWTGDFGVVRTIGFRALYVFVVLDHGRRRIRHWAVTQGPSLN